MDYSKLFYWLTVADSARDFFITMASMFTVIVVIATIANLVTAGEGDDEGREISRKWIWRGYPFFLVFWLLLIFTPSKKDALLIVAGGQTLNFLTNDESAKKIPPKVMNYVLVELENMSKEAKISLNIKNDKQKLIDEAKTLSGEELLELIKTNSNYSKILLDN